MIQTSVYLSECVAGTESDAEVIVPCKMHVNGHNWTRLPLIFIFCLTVLEIVTGPIPGLKDTSKVKVKVKITKRKGHAFASH